MMIQNNAVQRLNPIATTAKSNISATTQPDFKRTLVASLNKLNMAGNATPLPNAPQSVKDAWEKAQQETGIGINTGEPLSYIPSYMLAQAEQQIQTGNNDVFGSSVESALVGARKILDSLNTPLSAPSNAQVAVFREQEKIFYQNFIDHLTAAQSGATDKNINPLEMIAKSVKGYL